MGRDWLTPPVPPRAPRAPSPRSRGECASSKPRTTATIRESFSPELVPTPERASSVLVERTSDQCAPTCASFQRLRAPSSGWMPLLSLSHLYIFGSRPNHPRVCRASADASTSIFPRIWIRVCKRNVVLVNRYGPRVIPPRFVLAISFLQALEGRIRNLMERKREVWIILNDKKQRKFRKSHLELLGLIPRTRN